MGPTGADGAGAALAVAGWRGRALRQPQGLVEHGAAEREVGHQAVEAVADVVQVGLGRLGDERGAPRRDLGEQVTGTCEDPPQHQHRAEQLGSVGDRPAAARRRHAQVVDAVAQPVHRGLEAVGQVAHHLEQQEAVTAREPDEVVGIARAQLLEVLRKALVQRDHEPFPHEDPALVEPEGVTVQARAGEGQVRVVRQQPPFHVARAALLVRQAGRDQAPRREGRQRRRGRKLQVHPQEPVARGLGVRSGLEHRLRARSEVEPGGVGRRDDLDHEPSLSRSPGNGDDHRDQAVSRLSKMSRRRSRPAVITPPSRDSMS